MTPRTWWWQMVVVVDPRYTFCFLENSKEGLTVKSPLEIRTNSGTTSPPALLERLDGGPHHMLQIQSCKKCPHVTKYYFLYVVTSLACNINFLLGCEFAKLFLKFVFTSAPFLCLRKASPLRPALDRPRFSRATKPPATGSTQTAQGRKLFPVRSRNL